MKSGSRRKSFRVFYTHYCDKLLFFLSFKKPPSLGLYFARLKTETVLSIKQTHPPCLSGNEVISVNMKTTLVFRLSVVALTLFLLGTEVVANPIAFIKARTVCLECEEIVNPTRLNQAIHQAANYLLRMCDEKGKFVYRINLNPKVKPKPKYNMLRHAGTMYALAMYEQRYPNAKTRDTLARAAQFLKKTIAPIPGKDDLLAVWSYPEITGRKAPVQAKLGGTGLGLVALLSLEKIKPGTTPLEDLRKMGRFIVFMQKGNGSFYSKYIPSRGGKNDRWTSLFYPGEAALGLLMLYEKDPLPIWAQVATHALTYLARIRAGKFSVEADHWALLATTKWLHLNKKPFLDIQIRQHAVQISESMLATQAQFPINSINYGSFVTDGRTTPTATRLEGLLAALSFLSTENSLLRKRITSAVVQGLSFLLRAQIRSGKYAGGMPRAIRPLPSKHPRFKKSFNRRATEVRVDYVQHALSAMIQFEQMFY